MKQVNMPTTEGTIAAVLEGMARDIDGRALALGPNEERERRRRLVIAILDFLDNWHGREVPGAWVADKLGMYAHAVNDEWRKRGRSLPDIETMERLINLCLEEAKAQWAKK